MFPGDSGQPRDGAAGDMNEARGLSDAVVFGEVLQDREGFFLGQV